MHDNDPEVRLLQSPTPETEQNSIIADVGARKNEENLSRTQHETSTPIDDAPGWNEDLASVSEAHVKADRSSVTINDLQRKTIDYLNGKHQPDEQMDHREASYLRDEVTGPLGTARVGEFEGVVGAGDLGTDQEGADIESDGRTIKRHIVYEEITEVKADRGEIS
ncbi:hypothetical protein DFJ58DRAFT_717579 [Suillus subalutaceus]|uniref:uncharacterized protein n=1 Tax=Suillus subalutaceus TaxID=48586 RepID=UPI001B86F8AF|nr:uncharacterized protein DFJ58DRAFT_717579 [Suillus subalutaceus]KAG1844800.1 hypothetical protein DFJ58DRAFT_717579 [Suillus subalutaceus]